MNCGSVGKPKDGDPRAAFALLTVNDDGNVGVTIPRVRYPAAGVANEIESRGAAGQAGRQAGQRRVTLRRGHALGREAVAHAEVRVDYVQPGLHAASLRRTLRTKTSTERSL